jgi:hypothetical protein
MPILTNHPPDRLAEQIPFVAGRHVQILSAFMLLLFAVGCVPIQRSKFSTSEDEIGISPEKYYVSVNVHTQTSDPAKQPSIDTNRSFAVSPSSQRFHLQVSKNEYSEEWAKTNPTPWIEANLSLIDPSQQPGNSGLIKWKNGNWKLDLFFTGPTSRPPIHSEFRIYTFWYCPLFMRPY